MEGKKNGEDRTAGRDGGKGGGRVIVIDNCRPLPLNQEKIMKMFFFFIMADRIDIVMSWSAGSINLTYYLK